MKKAPEVMNMVNYSFSECDLVLLLYRIDIVYKEVKHNAELFPTSWSSIFSPNKFEVLNRKSFKGGKGDSLMVR